MAKKSDAGSRKSAARTPHPERSSQAPDDNPQQERQGSDADRERRPQQSRRRGGGNRSNQNRNSGRRPQAERPPAPQRRQNFAPEQHPFGPPVQYYDNERGQDNNERYDRSPRGRERTPDWTDQYYDDFYGRPQRQEADYYDDRRPPAPAPDRRPDFAGEYDDFYGPPAPEARQEDRRRGRRDDRRDERRDDRRDERRDDRRDDRRDERRGDRRDEQRGDRRSERRDDRRDERRDDRRDEQRGDRRDERRGDRRNEQRDERRDDRRSERRDDRRDERRDDRRDERRDDRRNERRDDRRDERRDDRRDEQRDDRRNEQRDDRRDDRRNEQRDDRRQPERGRRPDRRRAADDVPAQEVDRREETPQEEPRERDGGQQRGRRQKPHGEQPGDERPEQRDGDDAPVDKQPAHRKHGDDTTARDAQGDDEQKGRKQSGQGKKDKSEKPDGKTPKHSRSDAPADRKGESKTADKDDDGDRKPLHAQREAPPSESGDAHADDAEQKDGKGKRGKGRGKSSRRTADTRRLELPKIKISREFPSKEERAEYLEKVAPLPLDAWCDTAPAVRELILRVECQLRTDLAVDRGARIILAVSGGVDSSVMLDIMVELAFRNGYELFVAHFNHRLRGDSADSDEEFVRTRARELALPFIGGSADISSYASRAKISVEQASRDVRYRFLEQVARKSNAGLVATAHTANDTVETLLLNLMRGTGLTGLSGIPARRRFTKDCSLIRPFLNVKKAELEVYASASGTKWREDESNNLMLFTRNKIRHDLLPRLQADYSPAIVDILLRTSRLLSGADKAVTQMVERSVQRIVKAKGSSRITLLIAALQAHSEFLQGELLQRIIQKQFHILPLPIAAVDRLLKLMDADVGTRTDISGRLFALKDRETIIVAEKQASYSLKMAVEKGQEYTVGNFRIKLSEVAVDVAKFDQNPNVEFLDMETTPRRMTLRTWEPGDSFRPLGMRGSMKISDFLTNQKVPLLDKQHQLVLATSRDILWVVGHRISETFRVPKGAKTALKVEWSELEDDN